MTDFTKIRWANQNVILVTTIDNFNNRLPILILDSRDIQRLNNEWGTPFTQNKKGEYDE